jgi:DNA-binding response OmpR family regulator
MPFLAVWLQRLLQALLLDLDLPGEDGCIVLRRLYGSRLLSTNPVIVVTGQKRDVAE